MSANTYGRQVVDALTNKSGGGVIAGDVVIIDTGNDNAFTTTTTGAFTGRIGIAQETIANNATGRVLLSGHAQLVNVNASVTRGNFGKTHTVVKQATDAGSGRVQGTFCQFTTGGTTPEAIVFPPDLSAAALTNPMTHAEAIIKGGVGGTPTELQLGTAGGALVSLNGAAAYNGGTSHPTAVTGDRDWRTDVLLGTECVYDGTRWLGPVMRAVLSPGRADIGSGYSTNGGIARFVPWHTTYDLWLISWHVMAFVATTNDGTKYWTIALVKYQSDLSTTSSVSSVNTSAIAANTGTLLSANIGALYTPGTYPMMQVDITKTSTPGLLQAMPVGIVYRPVIT